MKIIDLSQLIYTGMPMHSSQPAVIITTYSTHETRGTESQMPNALKLGMSEHTGTHVDALSHMGAGYKCQSIDTMPLEKCYTRGVCLDLAYKQVNELIEAEDLIMACEKAAVEIEANDTVLLYTDHYRKHYHSDNWPYNPGLSPGAARWLGAKSVAAFGVESMAPGVKGVSNKEVHLICGELGFTHYENLTNLHLLVDKGPFRFIGFPLKIKGGTGSPVRAVAIFE